MGTVITRLEVQRNMNCPECGRPMPAKPTKKPTPKKK